MDRHAHPVYQPILWAMGRGMDANAICVAIVGDRLGKERKIGEVVDNYILWC